MKKPSIELLCTCGHVSTEHNIFPPNTRCRFDDGDLGVRCQCSKFHLDTLLYLEEIDRAYYGG